MKIHVIFKADKSHKLFYFGRGENIFLCEFIWKDYVYTSTAAGCRSVCFSVMKQAKVQQVAESVVFVSTSQGFFIFMLFPWVIKETIKRC